MATVLITGGTGLIGSALTKDLIVQGYKVIILTRKKRPATNNLEYKEWDPEKGHIDKTSIEEADYIVHLAGANVAEGRWTKNRRKEIVDSRVKSGELIVKSIKEIPNKVKAVLSSSAIGWYGPDPKIPNPSPFIETDNASENFLGHTCQLWEEAIWPVSDAGKRLVIFRTGIVLSKEGGAFAEFKKPLKFGLATPLGNGKQIVSWIHIDDVVQLYIDALTNQSLQGIYNAISPHPVSNRHLILTMAKQKGKFYLPVPVPAFALKLALGEMSIEILKSTTVSAKKIESTGFRFKYYTVEKAVMELES